jgi:hypothetical protein
MLNTPPGIALSEAWVMRVIERYREWNQLRAIFVYKQVYKALEIANLKMSFPGLDTYWWG